MEEMNSLCSARMVTLFRTELPLWEDGPREPGTKRTTGWIQSKSKCNSKEKGSNLTDNEVVCALAGLSTRIACRQAPSMFAGRVYRRGRVISVAKLVDVARKLATD